MKKVERLIYDTMVKYGIGYCLACDGMDTKATNDTQEMCTECRETAVLDARTANILGFLEVV